MNTILILLILFVIFILIICGLIDLTFHVGSYLILEDHLRKTDLIHVLSGPDYRTEYGNELMKKGFADHIFFTGGGNLCDNEVSAICSEKIALAAGIPADKIIMDSTDIINTYDEAERLNALINNSSFPIHSVIVVSDPFHMRRVRWTYQKVLGNRVKLIMAPVPFEMTNLSEYWWRNYESRKMVRNEYAKLIYYILRYQIAHGRFQLWLASLDHQ